MTESVLRSSRLRRAATGLLASEGADDSAGAVSIFALNHPSSPLSPPPRPETPSPTAAPELGLCPGQDRSVTSPSFHSGETEAGRGEVTCPNLDHRGPSGSSPAQPVFSGPGSRELKDGLLPSKRLWEWGRELVASPPEYLRGDF